MPPPSTTSRRAVNLYALLATFTACAESPKLDSLEQVRAFITIVVGQAATDEAEAFALLKAHIEAAKGHCPLSIADLDAIAARFTRAAAQRLADLGEPTGVVEFISEKRVGETMVREQFLQHRGRYPSLWTFDFYRTAGGWTLFSVNTDRDAAELLAF
ncbi:hypothetical protein [Pseudomonas turukhanskensis]|nr:hypothetical protein [Pseudomonas turukhanskensis]